MDVVDALLAHRAEEALALAARLGVSRPRMQQVDAHPLADQGQDAVIPRCLLRQSGIDLVHIPVHCLCMPTKTISVELDAYEKLKRARRNPRESFSSVIRRATWPAECRTGRQLLEDIRRRMQCKEGLPDEAVLDRLDEAQRYSGVPTCG